MPSTGPNGMSGNALRALEWINLSEDETEDRAEVW